MFLINASDSITFLKIMKDYNISKTINHHYKNFCYLLYFLHRNCYDMMCKFLPLILESLVQNDTSDFRESIIANLQIRGSALNYCWRHC